MIEELNLHRSPSSNESTPMRSLTVLAFVTAVTTPAWADDVTGTYDVKFEEMGQNCKPPPVALSRGRLTIAAKKGSLTVNIETIPELVGVPQKGGKINAKTLQGPLPTTVQGLDANYSIAGRIDDGGALQLVLVTEYIRHDDKKPHCTQSWNVTGARSSPIKPSR